MPAIVFISAAILVSYLTVRDLAYGAELARSAQLSRHASGTRQTRAPGSGVTITLLEPSSTPKPASDEFAPPPASTVNSATDATPTASAMAEEHELNVSFCSSWGYGKKFAADRELLQSLFPSLRISGSVAAPGLVRLLASRALNVLLYAALAYMLVGTMLLGRLGLEEPALLARVRESKLQLIVGYFVVNAVASSLVATGAYEVMLDGRLVFSKLASGGAPSTRQLAELIEGAGLRPAHPY